MNIDFGLTANDYAKHRAGFPEAFFDRVFQKGIVKTGDYLADLGTGTGTLARGFVSRGCKVTGLDISAPMLEQAGELSKQQGLDIEFRVAPAEETGLPAASFDVVSAGQCWHWFDRPRAAAEVKRILKPKGHVLIAHFDWIPLTGNVVDLTEKLIRKYNPKWYESFANGTGLYPRWLRDLSEAGFTNIETFSFDVDVPYSPEAWRGRIRASAGVGASLSDAEVGRFDSELKSLLEGVEQAEAESAADGHSILKILHRVFVVNASKAV
jgi:ubiquinone/menaquinone biosynthesis C-methylase UbiE